MVLVSTINSIGAYVFLWTMQREYVLEFVAESTIAVTAIIVFTVWTYVYRSMRHHILRSRKRRTKWSAKETEEMRKTARQQKTLTRIFFSLFVCQIICYTPPIITAFLGFFTNYVSILPEVYLVNHVALHSNAALNPIVLSIFKKPFRDSLRHLFGTLPRRMQIPCK